MILAWLRGEAEEEAGDLPERYLNLGVSTFWATQAVALSLWCTGGLARVLLQTEHLAIAIPGAVLLVALSLFYAEWLRLCAVGAFAPRRQAHFDEANLLRVHPPDVPLLTRQELEAQDPPTVVGPDGKPVKSPSAASAASSHEEESSASDAVFQRDADGVRLPSAAEEDAARRQRDEELKRKYFGDVSQALAAWKGMDAIDDEDDFASALVKTPEASDSIEAKTQSESVKSSPSQAQSGEEEREQPEPGQSSPTPPTAQSDDQGKEKKKEEDRKAAGASPSPTPTHTPTSTPSSDDGTEDLEEEPELIVSAQRLLVDNFLVSVGAQDLLPSDGRPDLLLRYLRLQIVLARATSEALQQLLKPIPAPDGSE